MPTPRLSPLRRLLAALAASTALLGTARVGWAQLNLPDPTSNTLTDDQLGEYKKLVDANKVGLTGKPDAIRRSREALQTPLLVPKISVTFRQKYSDLLVDPVLKPLVADPRDEVAINALILSGNVATSASLRLAEAGLADKRPSVRFAAAMAYRSTFRACVRELPALSANQATAAVRLLQKTLAGEQDPMVQDGILQAIAVACEVPDLTLPGVGQTAAEGLAVSAGDLARREGSGMAGYRPLVTAGKALFDLVSNQAMVLPNSALIAEGGYTGDVVSMARKRLASPIDEDERSQLALVVGQANLIYSLAQSRLGSGQPLGAKFDEMVRNKQDDAFRQDVERLIGKDGALTKPPFSLDPNRFAK